MNEGPTKKYYYSCDGCNHLIGTEVHTEGFGGERIVHGYACKHPLKPRSLGQTTDTPIDCPIFPEPLPL